MEERVTSTLKILCFVFLFISLVYVCPASAATAESGITKLEVGKERYAADQTFLVFTGGQNISIVATIGNSAYDKETDKWDYLIRTHFDKKNLEFVSEEYDGKKYTIWLRTKDMTDRNTTVSLDMMKEGSDLPQDQEHVYFNISRSHESEIEIVSPASSVPEERFKIDFDSGMSKEQEKSTGLKITGRLTGGNIPVDISLDDGDGYSPMDGIYDYNWTATNNSGIIDSRNYRFVVKDTVQTDKAVVVVSYPETAYVGQDILLDFTGTFVDNESATLSIYEGERLIRNMGCEKKDIVGDKTIRFDSSGNKKLTVKVWRINKDRMKVLESRTFNILVTGTSSGSNGEKTVVAESTGKKAEYYSLEDEIRSEGARVDYNNTLPKGLRDQPYDFDLSSLYIGTSTALPGVEYNITIKDWTAPDHPETVIIVYDSEDMILTRTFNTSGNKDFNVTVRSPEGKLIGYGSYRVYIGNRYSGSEENETGAEKGLWGGFIDWLKGN